MHPDYQGWCITIIAINAPLAVIALVLARDFAWHVRHLTRTDREWTRDEWRFAGLCGGGAELVRQQRASANRCYRFVYTCTGIVIMATIGLAVIAGVSPDPSPAPAPVKSKSVVPQSPSSPTKW